MDMENEEYVEDLMVSLRRKVSDLVCEDSVVFTDPDYDNAIVGIINGRIIYDYDLMVQHLMDTDDMSEEDAREFIDYNTIRTIPYIKGKAPIVVDSNEIEEEDKEVFLDSVNKGDEE